MQILKNNGPKIDPCGTPSVNLLYDKVLNLASDLKEHFNIGLRITQNQ